MKGRLEVYDTSHTLVEAVAVQVQQLLSRAVASRGAASLAFSGGSTPRHVYELLATDRFRTKIDWNRIHCFLGDERCVPPFHPESNFRMISDALLNKITIPDKNVHRVKTELPPEEAAESYAEEIRNLFQLKAGEFPEFDVLLLGMGEDGHTASLFPGTAAVNEMEKLATAVQGPNVKIPRVSLTFPAINNAAEIIFIVSGKGKAAILQQILNGTAVKYPAQMVNPLKGRLTWMADRDATMHLEGVH